MSHPYYPTCRCPSCRSDVVYHMLSHDDRMMEKNARELPSKEARGARKTRTDMLARRLRARAPEPRDEEAMLYQLRTWRDDQSPLDAEAERLAYCDRKRIAALISRHAREWQDLDDAATLRIANSIKLVARRHCRVGSEQLSVHAPKLPLEEVFALLMAGRAAWMDLWEAADLLAIRHGGDPNDSAFDYDHDFAAE